MRSLCSFFFQNAPGLNIEDCGDDPLILPLAAMIMENVDKKRGMIMSYAPQVLVKLTFIQQNSHLRKDG